MLGIPRLSLLLVLTAVLPAQHELAVTGAPEDAPFRVTAWADHSRIVVDLQLEPGWHAYSRDVGGGEPIALRLGKKSGVTAIGKLRLPPSADGKLHERVRIEQWIRAEKGVDQITARMNFMVCDPLQCLPPIELTLRGKLTPVRVLLVASSRDEHAERIAAFLGEQGFAVTTSLYDEVDTKTCDAHDVVLAASKLFRKDGAGGRKASSFPRTKTPIVAVGFLGHLLIENHGLAMTSGYI